MDTGHYSQSINEFTPSYDIKQLKESSKCNQEKI